MPKEHIEGWLNSDTPGVFQTARTKNNHGNIIFNPDNLPNGGLGMSLRNDKNGYSSVSRTAWGSCPGMAFAEGWSRNSHHYQEATRA